VSEGLKKRGAASASGEADRFFLEFFCILFFFNKEKYVGFGASPNI
jgi:hypothetical protein